MVTVKFRVVGNDEFSQANECLEFLESSGISYTYRTTVEKTDILDLNWMATIVPESFLYITADFNEEMITVIKLKFSNAVISER